MEINMFSINEDQIFQNNLLGRAIIYKRSLGENMRFDMGFLIATRRIVDCVRENREFNRFVFDSLERYKNCDWGEMDEKDKAMNDEAVKNCEDRIFAAYKDEEKGWTIWIITDCGHEGTTILFPEEY